MARVNDIPAFLTTLDPSNPDAFARAWARCCLPHSVDVVTDELLQAALFTLDHCSTLPADRIQQVPIEAAAHLLHQAAEERPAMRRALFQMLAVHCFSPNPGVAWVAIRRSELYDDYAEAAFPFLEHVARSDDSRLEGSMSRRAIAFAMMYRIDPSVLNQPELRQARVDAAAGFRIWAGQPEARSQIRELAQIFAG